MPKVTILMATYNRIDFIDRTIESVLDQSFKDWELVIADDGSTDNTKEKILAWQKRNPRIVSVFNPVNQGISKNYNSGFKVARGEFIAMIDDDDPWCDKDKLKKQVEFLEKNPGYAGCGGGVIVVNSNHVELYRYFKPETDNQIRARMLFGNPMANSTTMFRRAAGEKVGWYDESNRYSGDRDFWLKLGRIGQLYNFPEYFSFYTMAGQNTSITKMRPHLKASLVFMRRYQKDYPNYYSALFFNYLQYLYSFLPEFIRKPLHYSLARLKRLVVG